MNECDPKDYSLPQAVWLFLTDTLLANLFTNVILLSILGVVVGFVCFRWMESMGAPTMFWLEDWRGSIFNGFAVGTFLTICVVILFALDFGTLTDAFKDYSVKDQISERRAMTRPFTESFYCRLPVQQDSTPWSRHSTTRITKSLHDLFMVGNSGYFLWFYGMFLVFVLCAVFLIKLVAAYFQGDVGGGIGEISNGIWHPFALGIVISILATIGLVWLADCAVICVFGRQGSLIHRATNAVFFWLANGKYNFARHIGFTTERYALNPSLHLGMMVNTIVLTSIFVAEPVWRSLLTGKETDSHYIPAAAAVCVILSIIALGYGAIAFVAPRGGFILIAAIAAVFWFRSGNLEKYTFDEFAALYTAGNDNDFPGNRISLSEDRSETVPSSAISIEDVLSTMYPGPTEEGGSLPPLIVACASGGGITAASWTIDVLTEINNRVAGIGDGNAFDRNLRLISGASGGMVGASYYVAQQSRTKATWSPASDGPETFDEYIQFVRATIAEDALSPLVSQGVYDLAKIPFVEIYDTDRGRKLEKVWESRLGGLADDEKNGVKLIDWSADERDGRKPSLVFSPMIVETGQRLLISNLDMERLCGRDEAQPAAYQISRYEPLYEAIEVSTAARMSASFPVVSPAAALPTFPRLRVVDAGYYDNYGMNVAVEWIHWLADRARETGLPLHERVSGVLVVEIDLRSPKALDDDGTKRAYLQDLLAPATALWNARDAVQAFRNDELLENLRRRLNADATGLNPEANQHKQAKAASTSDFCAHVRFSCTSDVPLNWVLTKWQRNEITKCLQAPHNNTAMTDLMAWLNNKIQ